MHWNSYCFNIRVTSLCVRVCADVHWVYVDVCACRSSLQIVFVSGVVLSLGSAVVNRLGWSLCLGKMIRQLQYSGPSVVIREIEVSDPPGWGRRGFLEAVRSTLRSEGGVLYPGSEGEAKREGVQLAEERMTPAEA